MNEIHVKKNLTMVNDLLMIMIHISKLTLYEKNQILLKIKSILNESIKRNKIVKNDNNQNSLELVHKNIFKKLITLGPPFTKSKIDPKYKNYTKSIEHIKKHYKKHRNEIIDIFQLGKEYFLNPNFCYKPIKITIKDFFRYDQNTIKKIPSIQKLGITSWFNEFAKGKEYIESKYLLIIKDKNPNLTEIANKLWMQYQNQNILSIQDKNQLIKFTENCKLFADKNKLSARDIFSIVGNWLNLSDYKMHSPKFLVSDFFWNTTIIDILLDKNFFQSRRDINKL